MKNKVLLIILLMISLLSEGQIMIDSSVANFLSKYPDVNIVHVSRDTSYWQTNIKAELLFTENYYKDWNAGGDNIITGLSKFDWKSIYNKENLNWSNITRLEFGMTNQEDKGARKTNDVIEFTSNVGYLVIDKWYASAQFKFTSQFANGYDYGSTKEDNVLKTGFLSPGKFFIGIGGKYIKDDNFNLYISPFTENTTIVINDDLAKKGDINKNKKAVYNKLGPWVDVYWKYNFYSSFSVVNTMSVYTDYVHEFGSIDYFDWKIDLSMPIHKYLTVSIGFQTRYEKDILFDVEGSTTGQKETRVQIHQNIGIGFKYEY